MRSGVLTTREGDYGRIAKLLEIGSWFCSARLLGRAVAGALAAALPPARRGAPRASMRRA
jgi:hypothetical protein